MVESSIEEKGWITCISWVLFGGCKSKVRKHYLTLETSIFRVSNETCPRLISMGLPRDVYYFHRSVVVENQTCFQKEAMVQESTEFLFVDPTGIVFPISSLGRHGCSRHE